MEKKLRRIQIGKRRFAYTYGAAWFAVKEYSRKLCECGDSADHHPEAVKPICRAPGCDCKGFKPQKLLSFAVARPKVINNRVAREIIKEKLSSQKGEKHA